MSFGYYCPGFSSIFHKIDGVIADKIERYLRNSLFRVRESHEN